MLLSHPLRSQENANQLFRQKIRGLVVENEKLKKEYGCPCKPCTRFGANAKKLGQEYVSPHAVVDFIRDTFDTNDCLLVILLSLHCFRVLSSGEHYYRRRGIDCFVLQQRINRTRKERTKQVGSKSHIVSDKIMYQSLQEDAVDVKDVVDDSPFHADDAFSTCRRTFVCRLWSTY